MEQSTLLWLGTLALIVDYVGLARANDAQSRIVAFGFALLFWGAFALHSTGYYITTDSGVVIRRSAQSLTLLGILGAGVTLMLLFEAVMRAFASSRS
ncbi:MAG: hypothetical protein ABEI52_04895 [Halobacteriaceae archaeon]